MAKDSFWFKHDNNARNDEKILELRANFGAEGYGVFWMIAETMAEDENGYIQLKNLGGLSLGYGVAKGRLLEIINMAIELQLFHQEDGKIFSNRMLRHKEDRKKSSENGKKGAEKRWAGHRVAMAEAIAEKIREEEIRKEENREEGPVGQLSQEQAESMVVVEMMKVWEKQKPGYAATKEVDYPALLEIAYAIARRKGWKQSSVVWDKELKVIESWTKIVLFIVGGSDKFFKKLTIDGIANPKNFQKIEEAMRTEVPTNSNGNGVDFDRYQTEQTLKALGLKNG